jgi:hypothetical protein
LTCLADIWAKQLTEALDSRNLALYGLSSYPHRAGGSGMERKRRGRPSLGERVGLGLRVTPELKQLIDDAAKRSGRSQSQEVEFRLERSFERQHLLPDALELSYGRRLAGILLLMGSAMASAVRFSGKEPTTDEEWPFAAESGYAAVQVAIHVLGIAGWADGEPDNVRQAIDNARRAVRWHLAALDKARGKPMAGTLIAATAESLGPILDVMIENDGTGNADERISTKRRA